MSLLNPMNEHVLTSVSFPQEWIIEITWAEKRDQTETAGLMKTMYLDVRTAKVRQQYEELQDLVVELVEAGLLAIRNPPDTINPRRRFRAQPEPVEADAED